MRRKRRRNKNERPVATRGWWSWAAHLPWRRIAVVGGIVASVVVLLSGGWMALGRLDTHVDELLLHDRPDPVVEFINLPKELVTLANYDLHSSLFDLLGREWTDDHLCAEMATRIAGVGWVSRVNFVRRTGGGRFEISCRYRVPTALVQHGDKFFLSDAEAARLPGVYVHHPAWRLIDGVAKPAPHAGEQWEGDDIRAALAVLLAVKDEPFGRQIVGVAVVNFGGRLDPRACHIELMTDQAGGRIRWGSAPGSEIEENGVQQKLALLRENFSKTGRVDARHVVIDVSTFPDRYTIPG